MARLEELAKGRRVRGVSPSGPVTVIDATWIGSDVLNLTYEDSVGNVERELVYRSSEPELSLDGDGRPWSLDADPRLFTLASEAKRIRLAYLFDPFLAAEVSDVDPLPHQGGDEASGLLPEMVATTSAQASVKPGDPHRGWPRRPGGRGRGRRPASSW
jgi:hypothetical protein